MGVRLSALDFVPFKPDPDHDVPDELGAGVPDDYAQLLPYQYGFGTNANDPVKADLTTPENQHRFKMGEFPQGARIIPNSYNRIPGFSVAHHHFMPGFPVMAWPMMEWVLDHDYAHLFHAEAEQSRAFYVFEAPESTLTPLMEQVEATFPGIRVFSLPSVGDVSRGDRLARRLSGRGRPDEPFLPVPDRPPRGQLAAALWLGLSRRTRAYRLDPGLPRRGDAQHVLSLRLHDLR